MKNEFLTIEEYAKKLDITKEQVEQLINKLVITTVKVLPVPTKEDIEDIKSTLETLEEDKNERLQSYLNANFETLREKYSDKVMEFLLNGKMTDIREHSYEWEPHWWVHEYYCDIEYEGDTYGFYFNPKEGDPSYSCGGPLGGRGITLYYNDLKFIQEVLLFDADLWDM